MVRSIASIAGTFASSLLLFACAMTPTVVVDAEGRDHLINVDARGWAVQGHDVVAYWTEGKPLLGDERFQSVHEGATYLFASAEHKATFDSAPAKYAPQFGGYCAYAVSIDELAPIDPAFFEIVDGRLLLQYGPRAWEQWHEDAAGSLVEADANWPGIVERTLAETRAIKFDAPATASELMEVRVPR